MRINRNSYKYCIHCKTWHLILLNIWEFRPNAAGERVPYRCKIARRNRYAEGKGDVGSKVYYKNLTKRERRFLIQYKRLRREFNRGNITEVELLTKTEVVRKAIYAKRTRPKSKSQ
jgi:hypothetical protein